MVLHGKQKLRTMNLTEFTKQHHSQSTRSGISLAVPRCISPDEEFTETNLEWPVYQLQWFG